MRVCKDCPDLKLHCHSKCQRYLKESIKSRLMNLKGLRMVDSGGFYADVKENILRKKQREEKGRRIR